MANTLMCDGGCGKVHYEIDLFEVCYKQMMCEDCISTFVVNQGQEEVYDYITGER